MKSKHLVLGASGMIGRHLVAALRAHGHSIVAPTHVECDITDQSHVEALLSEDVTHVYLVAAETSVDLCTVAPERTAETNVRGVKNVVDAMAYLSSGAHLIFFSSDYIFPDGGPHRTGTIPDPLQEYGRQKLLAEHIVALQARSSTIVRTSWVWDDRKGFVFQLANSRYVEVAHDQWGTPTYAPHLVTYLLPRLYESPRVTKVLHVAGTPINRWEWAKMIKNQLGLPVELNPVTQDQLRFKARRPLRGGSISSIALPSHEDALRQARPSLEARRAEVAKIAEAFRG